MRDQFISVFTVLSLAAFSAHATDYYVDSAAGNDNNNGTSPSTAWKSLDKVNGFALQAGDRVLFHRGGTWRGNLRMKSGSDTGGKIVYSDYGSGNKPRLLGSVSLKDAADWIETPGGSHVWESQISVSGNEQFVGSASWYAESSNGVAYATFSDDSVNHSPASTASKKITFGATASTAPGNVQVFKSIGSLVAGQCYRLTFNAQASQPVTLTYPAIKLMRNGGNFDAYGDAVIGAAPTIGVTWASYEAYIKSTVTATDGRVNIYLGKLPAGITLNMDTLSLRTCDGSKLLTSDVGSLIFDDAQAAVGVKKLNAADLTQSGDFWYDAARSKLRLYSVRNPAEVYGQIEAALNQNIVSGASNVELRNLELRYGGAHGVGFGNNTQHVLVDGLDISYMGGSLLTDALRYGNGVQFWLSTSDATVSNTRLAQIYDVALTAQGDAENTVDGVTFRNNYVINSEQCFELWTRPEKSVMRNVTFTRNSCVGSGKGWSHPQRGAQGYDVLLYKNTAVTDGKTIAITDNIFYSAVNAVVRLDVPWNDYKNINFSGNCYYPQQGDQSSLGLLLNYTAYDKDENTLLIKDVTRFNSVFASNTSLSSYGDPQLIMSADGIWVPNPVGSCDKKGYAVPAGT